MAKSQEFTVTIDKLVHGGQGIGTLSNGKRALVWNVLPGETVRFITQRSKSSFVEGIAVEIIEPSSDRQTPRDELYLSTSPWQIMPYDKENEFKQEILTESLQRAGVKLENEISFQAPEEPWHYRNKMEYSFYGDEDGLHLALFNRGTHRKGIVTGSSIARPEIDETANKICQILHSHEIRAGDLKSVIVRCNRKGETVAAIFTRDEKFRDTTQLKDVCKGVVVYFSNPKSPASVLTKKLYAYGNIDLQDELLGRKLTYNAVSFFQVNLEAYELALKQITEVVGDSPLTDMYAGTGSIGLSVARQKLTLVEIDEQSISMARQNASESELTDIEIIHAPSEKATEYIPAGKSQAVVFDPPRAGLHEAVVTATLEALPEKICYLSCNPSTLARDLERLQGNYEITQITGLNFFPRTPHIEALAILQLKS